MNASEEKICAPTAPWSRGRFLLAAGLFFALQVGLILATAERSHTIEIAPSAPTAFYAAPLSLDQDSLARRFFAADPIVFASATPHGFSGNAWLRAQPVKYNKPEELEPPAPVELDTRLFGARMRLAERTNAAPFPLVEGRGAQLEPAPVFNENAGIRTQSSWRIEGPCAGLQIAASPSLASWPSTQLLADSVVEFAVNRAGKVVVHRLIGRSGSTDADTEALAVTRQFRFDPPPLGSPKLTWSKAIFQWKTIEPALK